MVHSEKAPGQQHKLTADQKGKKRVNRAATQVSLGRIARVIKSILDVRAALRCRTAAAAAFFPWFALTFRAQAATIRAMLMGCPISWARSRAQVVSEMAARNGQEGRHVLHELKNARHSG